MGVTPLQYAVDGLVGEGLLNERVLCGSTSLTMLKQVVHALNTNNFVLAVDQPLVNSIKVGSAINLRVFRAIQCQHGTFDLSQVT